MSFMEIRFPTDISYKSGGGPGFNTNIVVSDSGSEERVPRWQNAKREYDVRYGIKSREQMAAVLQFFTVVQGAAYGFRYKDWLDYNSSPAGMDVPPGVGTTTNSDQNIGTGDGVTTQFQLIKRYVEDSNSRIRVIEKPVDGTVFVAVDGTDPGSWSVDTTTGIVTFGSAPGDGSAITAGYEFDVPVRFSKDNDKILKASVEDYGYGSLDPITLVEIPPGVACNDDANTGGAASLAITANYTLSASYCRGYLIQAVSAGLSVILPDPTNLPTGGPFFWLANVGSNSFAVQTHTGSTLATLAAGQGADILLVVDGAGVKSWLIF